MTMDRHCANASSAAVDGMASTAVCRRLRTSALADAFRASSKEPKGTVTDAGSAMESGSLPRNPAQHEAGSAFAKAHHAQDECSSKCPGSESSLLDFVSAVLWPCRTLYSCWIWPRPGLDLVMTWPSHSQLARA